MQIAKPKDLLTSKHNDRTSIRQDYTMCLSIECISILLHVSHPPSLFGCESLVQETQSRAAKLQAGNSSSTSLLRHQPGTGGVCFTGPVQRVLLELRWNGRVIKLATGWREGRTFLLPRLRSRTASGCPLPGALIFRSSPSPLMQVMMMVMMI